MIMGPWSGHKQDCKIFHWGDWYLSCDLWTVICLSCSLVRPLIDLINRVHLISQGGSLGLSMKWLSACMLPQAFCTMTVSFKVYTYIVCMLLYPTGCCFYASIDLFLSGKCLVRHVVTCIDSFTIQSTLNYDEKVNHLLANFPNPFLVLWEIPEACHKLYNIV